MLILYERKIFEVKAQNLKYHTRWLEIGKYKNKSNLNIDLNKIKSQRTRPDLWEYKTVQE